jgi:hypothetical protein
MIKLQASVALFVGLIFGNAAIAAEPTVPRQPIGPRLNEMLPHLPLPPRSAQYLCQRTAFAFSTTATSSCSSPIGTKPNGSRSGLTPVGQGRLCVRNAGAQSLLRITMERKTCVSRQRLGPRTR